MILYKQAAKITLIQCSRATILLSADEEKKLKNRRQEAISSVCGEPYERRININRATSAYANQLCSDLSIVQLEGWADAQIVCVSRFFFFLPFTICTLKQLKVIK